MSVGALAQAGVTDGTLERRTHQQLSIRAHSKADHMLALGVTQKMAALSSLHRSREPV